MRYYRISPIPERNS